MISHLSKHHDVIHWEDGEDVNNEPGPQVLEYNAQWTQHQCVLVPNCVRCEEVHKDVNIEVDVHENFEPKPAPESDKVESNTHRNHRSHVQNEEDLTKVPPVQTLILFGKNLGLCYHAT